MNNTEFYDRLGYPKRFGRRNQKAYRKLSKKYHPDINKEPGAEDKYKEVQEAYETLSDDQNVLPMTSMVLQAPMVVLVELVVSVVSMGQVASVVLRIFSQVSSAEAVLRAIQTLLAKEMISSIVSI